VDQPLSVEQEKQMEAIMAKAMSGSGIDSDDQSSSFGETSTRREFSGSTGRRTFAQFSVGSSDRDEEEVESEGEERSVPMPRIRERPSSLSRSVGSAIDDDLLKRKPVSRSHNKRSRERAISNTALRSKRMRSILRVRVGLAEREVTISGSSGYSADSRDSRDSRSLEESQSLDVTNDAEVLRTIADDEDDESFVEEIIFQ
jgi:hypothetical protein